MEGPAVSPLVPPKNRHPERSASQNARVTQLLWRGVEEPVLSVAEGTSAVPILPVLLGALRPPKPDNTTCCDTQLVVIAPPVPAGPRNIESSTSSARNA